MLLHETIDQIIAIFNPQKKTARILSFGTPERNEIKNEIKDALASVTARIKDLHEDSTAAEFDQVLADIADEKAAHAANTPIYFILEFVGILVQHQKINATAQNHEQIQALLSEHCQQLADKQLQSTLTQCITNTATALTDTTQLDIAKAYFNHWVSHVSTCAKDQLTDHRPLIAAVEVRLFLKIQEVNADHQNHSDAREKKTATYKKQAQREIAALKRASKERRRLTLLILDPKLPKPKQLLAADNDDSPTLAKSPQGSPLIQFIEDYQEALEAGAANEKEAANSELNDLGKLQKENTGGQLSFTVKELRADTEVPNSLNGAEAVKVMLELGKAHEQLQHLHGLYKTAINEQQTLKTSHSDNRLPQTPLTTPATHGSRRDTAFVDAFIKFYQLTWITLTDPYFRKVYTTTHARTNDNIQYAKQLENIIIAYLQDNLKRQHEVQQLKNQAKGQTPIRLGLFPGLESRLQAENALLQCLAKIAQIYVKNFPELARRYGSFVDRNLPALNGEIQKILDKEANEKGLSPAPSPMHLPTMSATSASASEKDEEEPDEAFSDNKGPIENEAVPSVANAVELSPITLKALLQQVPADADDNWWQRKKMALVRQQADFDIAELWDSELIQNSHLCQHANFARLFQLICGDIPPAPLAKWLEHLAEQSISLSTWLEILQEKHPSAAKVTEQTLIWIMTLNHPKKDALLAKYWQGGGISKTELAQDKANFADDEARRAAVLASPPRLAYLLLDVEFWQNLDATGFAHLCGATGQHPLICDIIINYYQLVGIHRFDLNEYPAFKTQLETQLAQPPQPTIPQVWLSSIKDIERTYNPEKLGKYYLNYLTEKFSPLDGPKPKSKKVRSNEFKKLVAEKPLKALVQWLLDFILGFQERHAIKHPTDTVLLEKDWRALLKHALDGLTDTPIENWDKTQLDALWSRKEFRSRTEEAYHNLFKTLFNRKYTTALQYFCNIHLPSVAVPARCAGVDDEGDNMDNEWENMGEPLTINDCHPVNLCVVSNQTAIDVTWLPTMLDAEGYFVNPYTDERLGNADLLALLQSPTTQAVDWQTAWVKQNQRQQQQIASVIRQHRQQATEMYTKTWLQQNHLTHTEDQKLTLVEGCVEKLSQPELITAFLLAERLNGNQEAAKAQERRTLVLN